MSAPTTPNAPALPDERTLDAWAAEHVLLWRRVSGASVAMGPWVAAADAWISPDGVVHTHPPHPSTDAGIDYLVLDRVREAWEPHPLNEFEQTLLDFWQDRRNQWASRPWYASRYLPGDYTRAAWLAAHRTEGPR